MDAEKIGNPCENEWAHLFKIKLGKFSQRRLECIRCGCKLPYPKTDEGIQAGLGSQMP